MSRRIHNTCGFSLVELLVAMVITVGMGAVIFQLFQQNERIFKDQYLIMEMQQSGRLAIAQLADDIRMAGQGVPRYSATFDAAPAEAAVTVMPGSNASRLNVRAGFSNIESTVIGPNPFQPALGSTVTMTLDNSSAFASAVGRDVYVWGLAADSGWAWLRGPVLAVSRATNTVRLIVEQTGNSISVVQFGGPPRISLEEAVAIYRDPATSSLRRTTATSTALPTSPVWASANELAANITSLAFTYYDKTGTAVVPNTLADRTSITRIDARLEIQTQEALSNGARPRIVLSVRGTPRN